MKKLLLFVLMLISGVVYAQKGISYQAVILSPTAVELPGSDIIGQPFVNGSLRIKFAIFSGTTLQFEEVHSTQTDAYGLVNLSIGSVSSTAFNALIWDQNQKSLEVSVSFTSGGAFTRISNQKLTYSPYALFSETAGKLGGILSINSGGTGSTTVQGARTNLGLENVDNTSDALKPISSATQAALDLKANLVDVNSALDLKASAAMLAAHMAITVDTSMLATKAALTDLNNFAPINSPTFTGLPIAPTASAGTNSNQVATTAYADAAIAVALAASQSSQSGTSSQSVVDLTSNQTIAGLKTFSSNLSVSGKVGIGTASPSTQSSLDISTALPVILPKMTQSQVNAISSPTASMLQFNSTSKKLQVYKESVPSTSSVFGNTTLSAGATCLRGSGELWFRPTISGTITQIELSAYGAGEVASLVINSDYASGSPVLLGSSNSITAVDGWNTWTFATPVPVVANTTYFITSTDANRCLGVRWSNSGEDATTGNVSSMGFGPVTLSTYDPASRITVVVPATNGWVNLKDDVAITNLSTEVSNVLAVANGGTGSSTKNFVDLTSAQTVAGAKAFSGAVVVGSSSGTGTSAALEVKSTTQGLLLPRLTTTQRDAIAAPLAAGLLIYNSTAGKVQAYTEAEGTAATLSNVASSYAGLGLSYDYNVCLSFTPTANWRVSSFSLGVQSVATAGNITLSLYSGVPGSGILLGSQTVATSALSSGVLNFNFSTPITVPPGSCYWKATADNTALVFLPRLNQFNDGVNQSFTALRNNNTVVVNLPSYSFSFSMPYTPLIGSWNDLH